MSEYFVQEPWATQDTELQKASISQEFALKFGWLNKAKENAELFGSFLQRWDVATGAWFCISLLIT